MVKSMTCTVARLAALPLLALASACSARTATTSTTQPDNFDFARVADSIINTPLLHRAHLGIMVYDPATQRVLYNHNGARRFVPASNQKLLPTTTALHVLGPDFRYRTKAIAYGFSDSVAASLAIVGTGDPTWSS